MTSATMMKKFHMYNTLFFISNFKIPKLSMMDGWINGKVMDKIDTIPSGHFSVGTPGNRIELIRRSD